MIISRSIKSLQKQIKSLKLRNDKISLVPTMGSLHEGHLSHKPSGIFFFVESFNFLSFRLNHTIMNNLFLNHITTASEPS